MKYCVLSKLMIAVVILSFQLCFSQNSPQVINRFENEDFVFQYPSEWSEFHSNNIEKNVIIEIAPESEIFIKTSNKTYRKSNSKHHNKKPKNEFSLIKFNVSKESIKDGNLQNYMKRRGVRFNAKNSSKINLDLRTVYKQNDKHYIEILKFVSNEGVLHQNHLMHFRMNKNSLYILVFSIQADKMEQYINDTFFIFNSFEFKID